MKKVFKIFQLHEFSVTNPFGDSMTSIVRSEYSGNYESVQEAEEKIKEYLENTPEESYIIESVYVSDKYANQSFLF